jgi:hypothetical protein
MSAVTFQEFGIKLGYNEPRNCARPEPNRLQSKLAKKVLTVWPAGGLRSVRRRPAWAEIGVPASSLTKLQVVIPGPVYLAARMPISPQRSFAKWQMVRGFEPFIRGLQNRPGLSWWRWTGHAHRSLVLK